MFLDQRLLCVTAGLLFVNRAYKWHAESPWRSVPEGVGPASPLSQRQLLEYGDVDLTSITEGRQEQAPTN